jgi:drug/metabolite transporter (DMT)-like permease
MLRRVSRWGVTALGVVLAVGGVVAIVAGWDIIQVERGWSLFIGGAAALAGGAVVVALGQVVARLDEILFVTQMRRAEERIPAPSVSVPKAQPKDPDQRPIPPKPPTPQTPSSTPLAVASISPASISPAPTAIAPSEPAPTAHSAPVADGSTSGEPREVDRFESGDIIYVMYSDGAVEVRTAEGAQRFASLAELRAQAAQQY